MDNIENQNNKALKIIIVDDNKKFRKALRFFLEYEFNYEIIAEASNGNEFLQLKNKNFADVVLMDLMMPEKDGYETTFEATSDNRNLNVIAITSETNKAYLNLIMGAGFKAFVFKNKITEDLITIIKKVMNGKYCVPKELEIEFN